MVPKLSPNSDYFIPIRVTVQLCEGKAIWFEMGKMQVTPALTITLSENGFELSADGSRYADWILRWSDLGRQSTVLPANDTVGIASRCSGMLQIFSIGEHEKQANPNFMS
jgi:hypothetical protein